MEMNCTNCETNFSITFALQSAEFSWPEMRTFWYECIECHKGNHIRVSDGRYQQIEMIGAPGPEWEVKNTYSDKSISYRADEKYFHVWLYQKHYEIKARA